MNGILLIVLSQIIFGTVSVFVRLSEMPAAVAVFFRCLIASIALAIYFAARPRELLPILKWNQTLGLIALLGLITALNWWGFFEAVRLTSVQNTLALYSLSSVISILMAAALFKERLTARQWLYVATALSGALVVMRVWAGFDLASSSMYGSFCALGAGALYAVVPLIARYLKHVPALVLVFGPTLIGTIVFLPYGAEVIAHASAVSTRSWAAVVALGLLNTVLPFSLYFKGLKKIEISVAAVLQYLYALSSVLFAWLVFDERLTASFIVGAVLIIGSSYLLIRDRAAKKPVIAMQGITGPIPSPNSGALGFTARS